MQDLEQQLLKLSKDHEVEYLRVQIHYQAIYNLLEDKSPDYGELKNQLLRENSFNLLKIFYTEVDRITK